MKDTSAAPETAAAATSTETAAQAADAGATDAAAATDTDATEQQPQLSAFEKKIAAIRAQAEGADTTDGDAAAQAAGEDAGEGSGDAAASGGSEEAGNGDAPTGDEAGSGVIRLPGRREGEEFALPIGDPKVSAALEAAGVNVKEAVERLNQLKNGYGRRAEAQALRAEADERFAEIEEIYEELGNVERLPEFVLEHMNPAARVPLATRLLAALSEDEYAAIVRQVDEWDQKDGARETEATRAENARLQAANKKRTSDATQRAQRAWAKDVSVAINKLVPETMADSDAEDFFAFALQKLQSHIETTKKYPTSEEIPALMKELRVLERFGLSDQGGQLRAAAADAPAKDAPRTTRAAAAATGDASTTGERLQARAEKRRNAATAPAGAGSAAAGASRPPKGQSFKDRMAWFRKTRGLPPSRNS